MLPTSLPAEQSIHLTISIIGNIEKLIKLGSYDHLRMIINLQNFIAIGTDVLATMIKQIEKLSKEEIVKLEERLLPVFYRFEHIKQVIMKADLAAEMENHLYDYEVEIAELKRKMSN